MTYFQQNDTVRAIYTYMALPGHRRTSSDRKRRAAHFALKKKNLAACSKCSQPILAHRACANCGTYKGRQVIDVSRQTSRNLSKTQAKAAAAKPVKEKSSKAGSGSAGKEDKEKADKVETKVEAKAKVTKKDPKKDASKK